jgi:hypothetical protein
MSKNIIALLLLTVAYSTAWGITFTGTSTTRTVLGTPQVETTVLIASVVDDRVTAAGSTTLTLTEVDLSSYDSH